MPDNISMEEILRALDHLSDNLTYDSAQTGDYEKTDLARIARDANQIRLAFAILKDVADNPSCQLFNNISEKK